MEFKITVDVEGEHTHDDVKLRLKDALRKTSFQWKDCFVVTDLEGHHSGYIEGLKKGSEILNKVIAGK
tara:strand:+ start:2478 stop:2681 length:204 start_codon:yes stop_codon:yes gene_type:complete